MDIQVSILLVATIGTIATLIILVRDIWKDRRRVIVKLKNYIGQIGRFYFTSYVIEVVNHSRQDISIKTILATLSDGTKVNLTNSFILPQSIRAGDSWPFYLEDKTILQRMNGQCFKSMQVIDTLDNPYLGEPSRNVESINIRPIEKGD